jgi:glucokinase
MEIVAADIGGTHARFAIAEIERGRVAALTNEAVLKTAQHATLQAAWHTYGERLGRTPPRAAGIAFAGPVHGEVLRLTNSPWAIEVSALHHELGLDVLTLINDFGAVGHAVVHVDAAQLRAVCGPDRPLPGAGVISVIGPGTGLGVAQIFRRNDGYDVVSTEGGHMSFAPFDAIDDRILADLRRLHPRVSAERVVSGPGLIHIHNTLAAIEGRAARVDDDRALWEAALAGHDELAAEALERFLLCFGVCAGDIALAHGASAVVIAGGLGLRLADTFARSGFCERFLAKGRFDSYMADIPVKLITHPQPGLLGAAAAFAKEHFAGA